MIKDNFLSKSSIKRKYTFFTIIGILIASILVGGSSVFLMNQKVNKDTTESMNLQCQSVAAGVNDALASTEQSVRFIVHYINTISPSFDELTTNQQLFDNYNATIIHLFDEVTHDTVGAVTYYYRYNPKYFPSDAGFLYSKEYSHETLGDDFKELKTTDLSKFSPDDAAVAWFYNPLNSGEGKWISPYWGDNLQMNMISYVMPIYIENKEIGVIGMDIDFDNLLEDIESKEIYDSGYSFLIGEDGSVLDEKSVHNKEENKEAIREVEQFRRYLTDYQSTRLISYSFNGKEKRMVYSKLNNEMYLVFVADKKEIYKEQDILLNIVILIAVLITIICTYISYRISKKLTDPLEQLTEAASQLGDGKLDVNIPQIKEEDEVGMLARAFQKTVDHLQTYITYVQKLAYKDALTDVQNRAAYDQTMEQIDIDIRLGRAKFAMIMVDLNRLKKINDTYGHEMGNHYICNLCIKITDIFTIENVYRIGGDEFIIILKDDEYENRSELFPQIRNALAYKKKEDKEHPWENVTAATGMAVYDPDIDDSVDSVFKRADKEMYDNKIVMKSNHDLLKEE